MHPEYVQDSVRRAIELGVPPAPQMFRHAISTAGCIGQEKVDAKIAVLRQTLGWSKEEYIARRSVLLIQPREEACPASRGEALKQRRLIEEDRKLLQRGGADGGEVLEKFVAPSRTASWPRRCLRRCLFRDGAGES
ncbi:hypothetical protein ZWY2020_037037 [Hordeum vulgare]|nr:hypothetical protein ZWY2020_037037 [Hordeum vulgare]